MPLRSGQPERLIERVHSRPDSTASVVQESDTAPVGPSDHSGRPRLLAWLAEFLQVVELKNRFVQADSSSGKERACLLKPLGLSILDRVGAILKCLQPCANASIM